MRFFFHFRFFVYRPYTSAVSSAVIFSSLVQHNTTGQHKGKRLWLSYTISYFRILEILYVCTNLHSWNHHVPWIFSSETILIITWRKWKLLVRLLSIMRICQILVITSKSSSSTKQLKEKYYIKDTTIGVLTSPKQPFIMLAYRSLWNNRCLFLVFLEWKEFGNLTFEKE